MNFLHSIILIVDTKCYFSDIKKRDFFSACREFHSFIVCVAYGTPSPNRVGFFAMKEGGRHPKSKQTFFVFFPGIEKEEDGGKGRGQGPVRLYCAHTVHKDH